MQPMRYSLETPSMQTEAKKKTSGLSFFSFGATCIAKIAFFFIEVHQQKRCTYNQEVFFVYLLYRLAANKL